MFPSRRRRAAPVTQVEGDDLHHTVRLLEAADGQRGALDTLTNWLALLPPSEQAIFVSSFFRYNCQRRHSTLHYATPMEFERYAQELAIACHRATGELQV
jgi:hypothetical protein